MDIFYSLSAWLSKISAEPYFVFVCGVASIFSLVYAIHVKRQSVKEKKYKELTCRIYNAVRRNTQRKPLLRPTLIIIENK